MGPPALLFLRRKVCCRVLFPLKIHHIGVVWTRELGSNGKHAYHYTTEATDDTCSRVLGRCYSAKTLLPMVIYRYHTKYYSCCHLSVLKWCTLHQWYSTGGTRRHLRGYVDYIICITCIMYQQLWGYKVDEKLYLGVREQKRLNTTAIHHIPEKNHLAAYPSLIARTIRAVIYW
jgi:hypothetical protein